MPLESVHSCFALKSEEGRNAGATKAVSEVPGRIFDSGPQRGNCRREALAMVWALSMDMRQVQQSRPHQVAGSKEEKALERP